MHISILLICYIKLFKSSQPPKSFVTSGVCVRQGDFYHETLPKTLRTLLWILKNIVFPKNVHNGRKAWMTATDTLYT